MERIVHKDCEFYKWKVGPSTFLAWPSRGARLMHWFVSMADASTRDVIHWPDNPDYSKPRSIRGGNPILFPFAARTFYQGEENYWSPHPGKKLPMPRHGFAVDAPFDITDIHPNGFSARLQINPDNQQMYPFKYSFVVKYHFRELSLSVDLILKNEDTQPIPWASGHHFYFHIPWHEGLKRHNYQVDIPTKKAFARNEDGSLRGLEDCKMPMALDAAELVDRMHYKLKSPKVSVGPLSGEEKINLHIGGNPGPSTWTTVTTWTMDEHSLFYCIEPWMAPANAPEHKKGLQWVEPGATQIFTVLVELG